jgi:HEAT repeat protein
MADTADGTRRAARRAARRAPYREDVARLGTADWPAAYRHLDGAGRDALEALVAGLAHPHPDVRKWSAALLDHHADGRCLPGLVALLADPVAAVRRHALHSLGCQPCKPAPLPLDVVPLLLERARSDRSVRVRRAAVHQLGCQPPDGRAAEALRQLAGADADAKLRRIARWGLSRHAGAAGPLPGAAPGPAPPVAGQPS